MNKSSFFIVGQHAVIEALKNPKRKVLRVFLTEDAKKNIHRKNQKKNVLEDVKAESNPLQIPRQRYVELFGPTAGDRVRLADTDLVMEIEKDLIKYGDELVFGGGKSARDGLGQASGVLREDSADLVITNAMIIDPTLGIIKADIGIKDGKILGVGNAGNPNVMDDVDIVVSSNTEIISGEHTICTPGTIDSHIHFISPQQAIDAICNGTTTMIGGGTGPADGTNATTCTPGEFNIHKMIERYKQLRMEFSVFDTFNNIVQPIINIRMKITTSFSNFFG